MGRHIRHCDFNAFYASVETQRHPELRNKPLAVCGSQEELLYVGPATSKKLQGIGINTIGQLAESVAARMRELVGADRPSGGYAAAAVWLYECPTGADAHRPAVGSDQSQGWAHRPPSRIFWRIAQREGREKRYVTVLVRFDAIGKMRPVLIAFDEGHKYPVDKILDVRRTACQSVGAA